jgi:glycosyltransferase involved in cell wall biosynthesis
MKVSVVVCTYNRGPSLLLALNSVASQTLAPSVEWEIIVVDNNSTDNTREIVATCSERNGGRIRYVFESQQGLSRARNAGIREARGEMIVFVDDDVIAGPHWLQRLTQPMIEGEWVACGGRITAPHDFDPPAWFSVGGETDLLGALLPVFDLGADACDMTRPPYGANMAFRKVMFEKYGMFRVDLGRCGNAYLMGEDVEFGSRLIAAGERLRYVPDAVVEHPVSEQRLSKKFLRAWFFDFGRTRVIQRGAPAKTMGVPGEMLNILSLVCKYLPERFVQWMLAWDPKRRFYNECQLWMTTGEIVECYRRIKTRSLNLRDAKAGI